MRCNARKKARNMSMDDAINIYDDTYFNNFITRKKRHKKIIKRSAAGTTWENHKYKEIINGRYIYDEEADRKAHGGKSQFDDIREANKDKDWHDVIYDHVDNMIKKNPKLNTGMIATAKIEDFANTLKALTKMDVDNMTIGELEKMRKEIVDHYNGGSGGSGGQNTTSTQSVKKKSSTGTKKSASKYEDEKVRRTVGKTENNENKPKTPDEVAAERKKKLGIKNEAYYRRLSLGK